jgi:hypothetical protein
VTTADPDRAQFPIRISKSLIRCHSESLRSMFPPPLWGRVREGGGRLGTSRVNPSPHPSPTRGEGAHYRCRNTTVQFGRFVGSSHAFAFSPRHSREFCQNVSPSEFRGRRESRVPVAPAASCAKVESTRVSHHRFTGNARPSLRNGFNGLLRALPGDRALLPPSFTDCSAKLDASVGASGPHDFAVRISTARQRAAKASIASRTQRS